MSTSAERILYLDNTAVLELLELLDVLEVVRDALLLHAGGATQLPNEAVMYWNPEVDGSARSLALLGALHGGTTRAGLKVINANPDNPRVGLPRASGVLLLFHPVTARVRCIMQAEHVSSRRTAAVSALAIASFAPQATSLALIGAGPLARAHIKPCAQVLRGLEEVRLFDLDDARATSLAAEARDLMPGGVTVRVTANAREAVDGAGVVVPVTTTREPYLPHGWLAPNALVVNVGLDDCAEDVVEKCGLLVVDDWGLVSNDRRRLLGMMAGQGRVIGPREQREPVPPGVRRVDGELGHFLREPPAQRSGTILVNPFGMGIVDVALGEGVAAEAQRTGRGVSLTV